MNYFSARISVLVCLVLSLGTNFFQYATLDSGMSHAYLFFIFSVILYLTEKWYKKAEWTSSIMLGVCIGLTAITRPIDVWVFLIPLPWQNASVPKWDYIKEHRTKIFISILFAFIMVIPQLIYWKHVTGHWFYYSYTSIDYFEFNRIRVWQGLFGYRKGWFVYTPIALIGIMGSYFISRNSGISFYRRILWIFYLPFIYIVFSWHNWFYGWSFGCRALIDTLPLLAIPMAAFFQFISGRAKRLKLGFIFFIALLVGFNLFQVFQYNRNIIHGALMNKESYWAVFLKTKHNPEWNKMYRSQEIIDSLQGW